MTLQRYPHRPLGPFLLSALVVTCGMWPLQAAAENWPQWRGPHGNNVSAERDLPIVWSETRGLVWKCPLPEWGNSTPAIWGDAVFVTSHVDDQRLVLLKIDKSAGRIVWTRNVGSGRTPREAPKRLETKFHRLHNLATPSPVTDGKTVVVHFGNGDLAAYDFDGNQLWKRNLQEAYGKYSIWWGHGNSPVIHNDTVISVCMQDSLANLVDDPRESYVVAHGLKDGRTRWRVLRMTGANAEQCDSYTTPLIHEHNGRLEMIVMGGNQLDAYDPNTGEQFWHLRDLVGGRTVTGPTVDGDLVYTTIGMRGPLLAVRLGASGELSYRDVQWKYRTGTPDSVSPVVWGDLLFTVTDNGIVRCFDARKGYLKWKQRLPGDYKATPLVSEGRLFFLNTEGLCTVVSASPRFDKLTENKLDDQTIASPAAADGRIFIRGRKALYCVGR
jgi:outer membrane protein assembly factor BamB